MAAPTKDDAKLLLQAAELYNSSGLSEVARWIWSDDFPTIHSDFIEQNPPGSEGHSNLFRYAGYFETVATLWKHGLFNGDLLFDWLLIPWPRVGEVLVGERGRLGEDRLFENFEMLGEAQAKAG